MNYLITRKNLKSVLILIFVAVICNHNLFAQEHSSNNKNLYDLSLEELLNIEITTASNTSEKLSRAPATVIVITDQEIKERGYTEIFEILQDLPGFDYSRAFGDEEYYLYTRGYRKTLSDQMLLMVDGIVANFLWSNNMLLFAQYPVSNIKQIEIIYGPASAVYGTNAFTGVINIITKKETENSILLSSGANNTNIADISLVNKFSDFKVSFTGRIFSSDGYDLSDRNPSIQSKIYNDPNKWGPFIQTEFAGYGSKRYNYYLKGDISSQDLTVGFINWFYESGYGNEYDATKVLNKAVWQFAENMIYARYEKAIGENINSKTTLKSRISEAPPTSSFIERYSIGNGQYVVDYSYWGQKSSSFSINQDFAIKVNEQLNINTGIKYERKILQKGYTISWGPSVKADSVFIYPVTKIDIPKTELDQNNHYISEDKGVYMQFKYSPLSTLDLIAGMRYDYNNIYKDVISPRIGVVYEFEEGFIGKLFYGTAFLEPTARSLYGGWAGGISNVNLKPEKMTTYEGSITYLASNFSAGLSAFYNLGKDAIGKVNNINVNIGKRRMIGIEGSSKLMFNNLVVYLERLKMDFYISYIKSEEDLYKTGNFEETGNIAPIKFHSIITGYVNKDISLSIQSRYIDRIKTVKSNPVKEIDAWFTTDIYFMYRNIAIEGMSVGIRINNLFDAKYDHPGYGDASAGIATDAQGDFIDNPNGGWYTSLLPQQGRELRLILRLDL